MPAISPAQERADALAAGEKIINEAKVANRDLTESEVTEIKGHLATVDRIDAKEQRSHETGALLDQITRVSGETYFRDGTTQPAPAQTMPLYGDALKSAASPVVSAMRGGATSGTKALAPSGTTLTDIPLTGPYAMPGPAPSLFAVLTAEPDESTFSYLRQTTRTNNAAPVASGALKPTSVYGLTPVEDRLRVIAHVSEPIDRFWLDDSASLRQFVTSELLAGLADAVEGQILSGDGLGENLTGLLNTSGIQVQAFTADPVHTARAALTKAQTVGPVGTGEMYFVLNPADWEAVETYSASTGEFLLQSGQRQIPVSLADRLLWGQRVVLSNRMTAGTGLLVQRDAVTLKRDRAGIRVDWSEAVGDDFSKNVLRARCEGRFGLAVTAPLGVVKLTLTGV